MSTFTFSFDEKEIYSPEIEEVEDAATLLLSDQLMEDDEDSEIYEMDEEDFEEEEYEIIPGTSQPKYSDDMDSFAFEDEEEESSAADLVQENPFEPVYPATAAALLFDENASDSNEQLHPEKGMVLEAISLDNILPAGSRRRRN